MANKRKIEVFTAGCPLCDDALARVTQAVSACGCEVIERRCTETECCAEAKEYGVKVMPSVVVDGHIIFEGAISAAQAALLAQ